MTQSKTDLLLVALRSNTRGLTATQITYMTGLANPRAAISHMRYRHGYPVQGTQTTDRNGHKRTVYRMVRPSNDIIAAGYRALLDNKNS
jgi:hypothetical protein